LFDLRPARIIEKFGLKNPIFEETAAYGHFGHKCYKKSVLVGPINNQAEKEVEFFTWEKLDSVDAIKKEFGL
jgi:S-adenosylmethionine synthetase